MRKVLSALLALATLAVPAFADAQTGPKYGKNGGIGASGCTYVNGEPTGGGTACKYSIDGTTGAVLAGSVSSGIPIPVTSGGTGGSTVSTARAGIGAAASGANSDITSLSGLNTKLTLLASTSGIAFLRLTPGVSPTNPVPGDIWTTSAGLFTNINGSVMNVTQQAGNSKIAFAALASQFGGL